MNNDVYNDIKQTMRMINENSYRGGSSRLNILSWAKNSKPFSKFSQCYLFSNENLSAYYNKMNIDSNNILTVTGSGDQVLSAILLNSKVIDTFDSNMLSYYNLMLKKYSILSLEYNDFKKFYFLDSCTNRLEMYKNISCNIKEDSIRIFWDEFFTNDANLFKYCFLSTNDLLSFVEKRIPYMNSSDYVALKSKLLNCNINFKNVDILDISKTFFNNYSFINLSNILQYVLDKRKYINLLNNLSDNHLLNNGMILLNYYWNIFSIYGDSYNQIVYSDFNVQNLVIDDLAIGKNLTNNGLAVVYQKKSK